MADWVIHAPILPGLARPLCRQRTGIRQRERTSTRQVSVLGFGRARDEETVTCLNCLRLLAKRSG